MNNDRTKSIGGSDIAPILSLSPWVSSYQLYLNKTNSIYNGNSSNLAMELGHELEGFILRKYVEETGNQLITDKALLFKTHKDYPFLSGNIDAITIDGKTIVEAKTSASKDGWGEQYTDEIPEHYKLQIAHYANIWDIEKVDIVLLVLGRGKNLYYYTYHRDKSYETHIQKSAILWWEEHVLGAQPPECSVGDITNYEKDKVIKDSIMQINPSQNLEVTQRIGAIDSANKAIKDLEKKVDKNKRLLANILKNKEILQNQYGKALITYKLISKKGGIDTKRLQVEHPEIYNKYLKKGTCYRQLTIK